MKVSRLLLMLVVLTVLLMGCSKSAKVTAPPASPKVDLSLGLREAGPLVVGSEGLIELIIHNRGTQASVVPLLVRDTLPIGIGMSGAIGDGWLVGVTETGVVNASLTAPIAPGDSAVLGLRLSIGPAAREGGKNVAIIQGGGDETPQNNRVEAFLGAAILDVALRLSAPQAVLFGNNLEWRVTVVNEGSLPTGGAITITDSLPPEAHFVNAAGSGWQLGALNNVVVAMLPTNLNAGDSSSFVVRATVTDPSVRYVGNRASMGLAGDQIADNNAALSATNVDIFDLSASITRSGGFDAGSASAWILTVTNVGTLPVANAIVAVDSVYGGARIASASSPEWQLTVGSDVLQATRYGVLAPGESSQIQCAVDLSAGGIANIGNALAIAMVGDQNPLNDRVSDELRVVPAPGVELIVNGSFEDGPGYRASLAAGNTSLRGWTIFSGGVDYEPVSGGWCSQVKDSAACIDLSSFDAGGVSQAIPTIPGARYELRFWIAGNWDSGPIIKTLTASAAGRSIAYSLARNGSASCQGWTEKVLAFTAVDPLTDIVIASTTRSAYGPLLDLVSVKRL